jgi:hypothetical protein
LRLQAVHNIDFMVKESKLTITIAHKLISALVCDAQKNFVAAGIENPEDGPGVSPVYIWYST